MSTQNTELGKKMLKVTNGSWIENPRFGQRLRVVKLPAETGGVSYEVEYFNQPFTGKGAQPIHFHRTYTERFEILSGKACYQLGDKIQSANQGEVVVLPPVIPHLHPWSDSAEELRVRQMVDANPPDLAGLNACLNTGITFYGLARDGKVDKNGLPSLFQLAVSAQSTMPGTWSPGLPIAIQHVLIGFLAWLGRMRGYRTSYPAYGEV